MNTPLAVDLDGTLVNTDLFFESAIWYLRKNPFRFFQMCWWFFSKGRAELKLQIEKRADLPISNLPFNQNVVQWLRDEKNKGRELVLVTGASQKYAEQVAEHLGLFSKVFGVYRERPRLTGRNKARFLVDRYGEKKFDYIGNSIIDLAVWKKSRRCITAHAFSFVNWIARKRFSQVQVLLKPFSIRKSLNVFKKCFAILFLRIFIFILPAFFILFSDWFGKDQAWEWTHFISNFILILPIVILFYMSAFLLGELKELGPNRIFQRKGIFVSVHPYWGLLSFPFLTAGLLYLFIIHDLLSFSAWWFLAYFTLEYMRWTFKKYSLYYDLALTGLLWFLGFSIFDLFNLEVVIF